MSPLLLLVDACSDGVSLSTTLTPEGATLELPGGAVLVIPEGALTEDVDVDGIDDRSDNCPGLANPDQLDGDADGLGAACDEDELTDTGSGDSGDPADGDTSAGGPDDPGTGGGEDCGCGTVPGSAAVPLVAVAALALGRRQRSWRSRLD